LPRLGSGVRIPSPPPIKKSASSLIFRAASGACLPGVRRAVATRTEPTQADPKNRPRRGTPATGLAQFRHKGCASHSSGRSPIVPSTMVLPDGKADPERARLSSRSGDSYRTCGLRASDHLGRRLVPSGRRRRATWPAANLLTSERRARGHRRVPLHRACSSGQRAPDRPVSAPWRAAPLSFQARSRDWRCRFAVDRLGAKLAGGVRLTCCAQCCQKLVAQSLRQLATYATAIR
jgi:hypothetical protein